MIERLNQRQEKRDELIKQYEELKTRNQELSTQVASLHERDPVIIDEMSNLERSSSFLENNIEKAVEGVNRWTGINR